MKKPLSTGRAILYVIATLIIVGSATVYFKSTQKINPWHRIELDNGRQLSISNGVYKQTSSDAKFISLFIYESNDEINVLLKDEYSGFASNIDSAIFQIKFDNKQFEPYEVYFWSKSKDENSLKNVTIVNSKKIFSEINKHKKIIIKGNLYNKGEGFSEFNIYNYKDKD